MDRLENSELLTKEDLAAIVEISVHTIKKWNARGTGPRRVRIGRKVFYRRSDVVAWINGLESK